MHGVLCFEPAEFTLLDDEGWVFLEGLDVVADCQGAICAVISLAERRVECYSWQERARASVQANVR